ncbi:MAG: ATP-binding protein [Chloroflexi bacterium]|nr:ATP-binding protein [Chloroflexota bacterium]
MAEVEAYGDELELPYSVPTHLEASESIGPIPHRLWAVRLGAWMASSMALATLHPTDDLTRALVQWGPVLALAPFGAWWLHPPPEHGLMTSLRHLTRPRLLDPDRLHSYQRMRVENGAVYTGTGEACLTVWRLPTVNLDVASAAARRRHRAEWGAFLDALGHEVTIVIRARRMRRLQAIFEVFEHGSQEARVLAKWLQTQLGDRPLIDRERLLVVPAPDRPTLQNRCDDIRSSMAQFDWRPIEPESDNELQHLVHAFWPLRPALDRLGPAMIQRKQRELIVDGEYVRTYALRDFPATVTTDWWSHLTDGDLPVDVAMEIRPRNVGEGKRHLDRREIALATSRPTREREVALEQVRALAMAMERSQVKPFDVAVTLAIRGSTRTELEQLDRRLRQRIRDRGNATIHLLTWEQLEGLERVVPLGRLPLPRRGRRVETGTLARTTPLCSATLQLEGGVPLGEAGSAPCLFWTRAGQKNAHMAVYGGSGAGKGYLMRVYHSRKMFQHDVSIWVIDSDEQHEYAGRFCEYLHGQAPAIRRAVDVDQVPISRRSRAVVWDLSQCPDDEYGAAVVRICDRLIEYVDAHQAPTDFLVDEAVNILRSRDATQRLNDLIQRGRHWGIGVNIVTQLPSDWFGSHLGRRVHGLVDSWWCGQQNPAEVDAVASVLRLTTEEKAKIEAATSGVGLLATFNGRRRAWLDLFDKVSLDEHAMAHSTRTAETRRRRVGYLEHALTANGQVEICRRWCERYSRDCLGPGAGIPVLFGSVRVSDERADTGVARAGDPRRPGRDSAGRWMFECGSRRERAAGRRPGIAGGRSNQRRAADDLRGCPADSYVGRSVRDEPARCLRRGVQLSTGRDRAIGGIVQ